MIWKKQKKWKGRKMGGGEKKMLPLNTVRVKTKELDSEEMRFGESVGSNLWFDFGSPWLSVRCKEGLCVSLGALPAALMNLRRPWEWLMHLFMETEPSPPKKTKTGGCKIHL